MSQIVRLEEKIAHLTRVTDDLSDIVARQEREIAALRQQVRLLMEREASREAADPAPSTRPPHW